MSLIGDAWVSSSLPDSNLDGGGLGAGSWITLNRSFLKFQMLDKPVGSAKLKLYGRYVVPTAECRVFLCSPFDPLTVTWNNQPAIGIQLGSTQAIPEAEGWFEVDLCASCLSPYRNQEVNVAVEGNEEFEGYFYAEDMEGGLGLGADKAPQMILTEGAIPLEFPVIPMLVVLALFSDLHELLI